MKENKKRKRNEPLIAVLEEALKIQASLKATRKVAQFKHQVTRFKPYQK